MEEAVKRRKQDEIKMRAEIKAEAQQMMAGLSTSLQRAEALSNVANLHILPFTHQVKSLLTIIRNRETVREDFVFYADRLIRLLVEESLNYIPTDPVTVETTDEGVEFTGARQSDMVCGVSVVRAGESMETALRAVCKQIKIGKILIQRDEETALPKLIHMALPSDIKHRHVLLMDPMLATGGSANKAIEVLMDQGVPEDRIILVTLMAAPEGVLCVAKKHPTVHMITSEVDEYLNDKAYIIPGIGDFGDRYFGTDD